MLSYTEFTKFSLPIPPNDSIAKFFDIFSDKSPFSNATTKIDLTASNF